MGRKKAPIYKIVAADSRARRDGRYIEAVGLYNPNVNPAKVDLAEDRALYWLTSGAQPTVTVKNILSHKGLMLKHHLKKTGADESKLSSEFAKWESLQESKLQRIHDKKLRRKEKKRKAAEKPEEKPAEVKPAAAAEAPAPVKEAPVKEAPIAEAPVEKAPVAEAPVVEAPVVETPVAEAPVTEAPASEQPEPEKKD